MTVEEFVLNVSSDGAHGAICILLYLLNSQLSPHDAGTWRNLFY